ncbi:hypothetical protein ACXYTC_23530, partial [Escherichia coli]
EMPRGRQPIRFTLEGMLPGENQSIPKHDSNLTPNEIIEQIESWTNATGSSGKEIRFIVSETDWNLPVFLGDIESEYSGGYGDIIY